MSEKPVPNTKAKEKAGLMAAMPVAEPPASLAVPAEPTNPNPLACRFDYFPKALVLFAEANKITPLKWRVQKGEYILFSDRLQKYHVPME